MIVPWPQALRDARALSDDQLAAALAGGCTATDCVAHGAMNHVRNQRKAAS